MDLIFKGIDEAKNNLLSHGYSYLYNYKRHNDFEKYRKIFDTYPLYTFTSTIEYFYQEPESWETRFVVLNNDSFFNSIKYEYVSEDNINFDSIIYNYKTEGDTLVSFNFRIVPESYDVTTNKYTDNNEVNVKNVKSHSFLSSVSIGSNNKEVYDKVIRDVWDVVNSCKIAIQNKLVDKVSPTKYYQKLIVNSGGEYGLKSVPITVNNEGAYISYDTNVDDHYNLIKNYNEHVNKFLVMYHGAPGTGKTHFLKYLSYKFSSDDFAVVSIPTSLVHSFGDPSFALFLSSFVNDYKRVVFKLEDSEDILFQRGSDKQQDSSNVSTLLNLIDGDTYFSTESKVIFFCTFNTDLNNIDPALLRAGRLFYKYEFGKLSVNKCNELLKYYNSDRAVTEPTEVANIYEMIHKDKNKEIDHILNKLKDEAKNIR